MVSPILLGLLVLLSLNSVFGETCGGLLEGETGQFSFGNGSNQKKSEISSSACLWVIQLHYENNVRFTLNGLGEDAYLNLYSEGQLTSCSLSNSTNLNSTQVGSSFEFVGKTLIVVLPISSASVSFSWHFIDKNGSVASMKNSDYINSPNGHLEWEQLETKERVTWAINPNANFNLRWDVQVARTCHSIDNCGCFNFAIFQLTSGGLLREAIRTCGQSSEGQLKGISGRAVVLIKVDTNVEANKVALSWGLDDDTVIEPPVTNPPVPNTAGLFASTASGLISLDLQTLEVTVFTSKPTVAVAVNHKLSKVYWSEGSDNASIIRSNLNGSEREIIVPQTGNPIYMLAIEEASGDVYFSLYYSHEITVCNALGKNCAVVIANSSLVHRPIGLALDSEKGVMYWGYRLPGAHSLVRANLDGSNATIISTGFTDLRGGIIIDEALKDVIFWTDFGAHIIGTVDFNGGNKQTILELDSLSGLWGIQLNNDKMYFSTRENRTILSVDRNSGKELSTIFNSTSNVFHLALYNANVVCNLYNK